MTDKKATIFLSQDTRNENSTVEDVKNYVALRAPELVGLTFTDECSVVTHYMGIDALYRKFKEYKHDNNKDDSKKHRSHVLKFLRHACNQMHYVINSEHYIW